MIQVCLGTYDDAPGIGFQADDELGRAAGQTQAAPLSDGEVLDALVPPQHVAGGVHDVAGLFVSALAQELAVVAGGNKADVLAVGLVGVGKAGVGGQLADFRLGVASHRHQRSGQLLLTHPEEDVGLVLVGVGAASQSPLHGAGAVGSVRLDARVVAGGDVAGLHHPGALGQEAELDFVVAGDARVRRASAFVLALEVVDDEGAELALHVEHVVGYAEDAADGAGILNVVDGAAAPVVFGQVGLVNVVQLHSDADDVPALPMEQQGGNGGVHAAAHGDDGAAGGWGVVVGDSVHISIVSVAAAGCSTPRDPLSAAASGRRGRPRVDTGRRPLYTPQRTHHDTEDAGYGYSQSCRPFRSG